MIFGEERLDIPMPMKDVEHFESPARVAEEDHMVAEDSASDALHKLRTGPAHLAGQARKVMTVFS